MADNSANLPVLLMRFDGMDDDDTINMKGIAVPELRALNVKKMTFPVPDRKGGTTTTGGCLVVRPPKKPEQGFLLYMQDEQCMDRLISDLKELRNQLFGIKITEN